MVSCIVTIFGLSVVVSKASSVILFLIPFILSWIILKSLGLVVGSPEVEELVEEEEDEGDVEDDDVEGEEVVDGDGGARWKMMWVKGVRCRSLSLSLMMSLRSGKGRYWYLCLGRCEGSR